MKTIEVCIGSACHLKGAYNIVNGLQKLVDERNLKDEIIVKAAFCLGECTKAVSTRIDNGPVISVDDKNIEEYFERNVLGRK
ncbi:(2Fe-2S) ferredoxin domain-containing protein [Senegalia massiliensis]|uniref:(2Fe-2S) ferredoxin domain-containing protein n=1 Tax=Senegalia massiliensis TaxID=1720316 RepID=A0A845QU87_9CLOT|nr:(2Fe-2S) ferredoxin domain-containing protein [Senegalia massiliensis]NBI05369.1 (2Fe-2S) ferredoxin domain-containing protein [Senegalia massiliensis]